MIIQPEKLIPDEMHIVVRLDGAHREAVNWNKCSI
jgi:hypothetical protein